MECEELRNKLQDRPGVEADAMAAVKETVELRIERDNLLSQLNELRRALHSSDLASQQQQKHLRHNLSLGTLLTLLHLHLPPRMRWMRSLPLCHHRRRRRHQPQVASVQAAMVVIVVMVMLSPTQQPRPQQM